MKRTKKSQKKTKFLLLLLVLTAILSITATYAWFSTQREVEITGIKLNVEVAESMQISLDGAKWYQNIAIDNMRQFYGTYSSTTVAQAGASTNKNYVPTELLPVSTVGEVEAGAMRFMTGSATMSGNATSATLTACSESDITTGAEVGTKETNNKKHPYLVFDMYLRNYSKDSTADELQLNAGSKVYVDAATSSQEGTGVANTGLENSARVGFVIYDNTADVTAESATIVGLAATNPSVVIWEPNDKEHITEVISSGRATATQANTTYGVKYAEDGVTINDVYADATDTKLAKQTTFAPAYTATGVTTATTMTTSAESPANVTIAANKVTKVRVYIWLEGQDVDCINTASQGDRLLVDLKLTKPENTAGSGNTYTGNGSTTTTETTTEEETTEETTENT